jgi:hypothetical protein
MVRSRPDLTGFGGIQPFWLDPAKHACWNSATATGCCRISVTIAFLSFVIFLCKPMPENIFKIISSKIFYDENHFTSKQTEHKLPSFKRIRNHEELSIIILSYGFQKLNALFRLLDIIFVYVQA